MPAAGQITLATGLELVEVPAGPCLSSAPVPDGFAYDNERPRHIASSCAGFMIGLARPSPTTAFRDFVDGGGYSAP